MPSISKFGILKDNFSNGTFDKLIDIIEEAYYSPGEIIYKEDIYDEGNSNALYLLTKGEVELFYDVKRDDMESEIRIKTLKVGDYFNDVSFFSDQPDDFSARSIGFSTVFKIKRTKFHELIRENESDIQTFCKYKEDFLYKGY